MVPEAGGASMRSTADILMDLYECQKERPQDADGIWKDYVWLAHKAGNTEMELCFKSAVFAIDSFPCNDCEKFGKRIDAILSAMEAAGSYSNDWPLIFIKNVNCEIEVRKV